MKLTFIIAKFRFRLQVGHVHIEISVCEQRVPCQKLVSSQTVSYSQALSVYFRIIVTSSLKPNHIWTSANPA
jgi:hypothetical protein